MAVYYLDSSALVKRYTAEVGTIWIRTVTSPSAGHLLFVALISGAEVVAAVAKRERMGPPVTGPIGAATIVNGTKYGDAEVRR